MERVIKKLKTEDAQLKLIAEKLIEQAEREPVFIEKILNDNKTLEDCFNYIKSKASKKAKNGFAMIPKEEVFNDCIHYFDEEKLKDWKSLKEKAEEAKAAKAKAKKRDEEWQKQKQKQKETKTEKQVRGIPKPKGVHDNQVSLFDL